MKDPTVSATSVCSALLWTAGVLMALLELLTSLDIGVLGIVAAVGGATLTVRGFFCHQNQCVQNAFEVGRDLGEKRVRSVH